MTSLQSNGPSEAMTPRNPVSPAPYIVQDELTFLDFLIIVTRRKRFIGMVTVIFTVSALLIAFLLPQKYTATVIILPPQGNPSMGSMLSSQIAGMSAVSSMASSALGLKNTNEMYVSMLKAVPWRTRSSSAMS